MVPATAATEVSALSDTEIAESAVLTREEVGEGFAPSNKQTISWSADEQPAVREAACAPFVDSVFESSKRPATSRAQAFQRPASSFQQYVVVFPSEQGAIAMMDALADPAFPECLAAVAQASYEAGNESVTGATQRPAVPRTLAEMGDQMVVLALKGSYVFQGTAYGDEGLVPFVRVGRAIVTMNPNAAESPVGSPGYPDEQLEKALAIAAERLRTAQDQ